MFTCQLRSPDETFYDGHAVSVTARSPRGEFCVLTGHAPLLAELAAGPLRIQTPSGAREFAVFGGTLFMSGDRAVIQSADIVAREAIDLASARCEAEAAGQPAERAASARARLAVLEKVAAHDD